MIANRIAFLYLEQLSTYSFVIGTCIVGRLYGIKTSPPASVMFRIVNVSGGIPNAIAVPSLTPFMK